MRMCRGSSLYSLFTTFTLLMDKGLSDTQHRVILSTWIMTNFNTCGECYDKF